MTRRMHTMRELETLRGLAVLDIDSPLEYLCACVLMCTYRHGLFEVLPRDRDETVFLRLDECKVFDTGTAH